VSGPTQDLRVTLVQGDTRWHDPAGNRDYYASLVAPLAGATDLVLLPETFTSGFSNDALANAETMDGATVAWLRGQAATLGAVVAGSMQLREGDGVYNRLLWASPDGDVRHYDKRHLFRRAKEHERYAAGRDAITVALKGWRIRPLVCYDLRFPVFIRNRHGHDVPDAFDYDLLVFVANWPAARRHAWRTLLKARAIENLCYVAGVNRVGTDGAGIEYAGDSVAVDYLGMPIVELDDQPQVATVSLSAAALAEHRTKFPAQLDADAFTLDP
jgi:predicted amidohydrolase